MEPYLDNIDNFVQSCKYFQGGDYICSYSGEKEEQGRCFAWTCPFCHTADLIDLQAYDKDLYEEYKSSADKEGVLDQSHWIIVYKEVV